MAFIKIFRCGKFAGSSLFLKIKSTYIKDSIYLKFSTRIMFNPNTAYLQHSEGEERVQITIAYNSQNKNKILNFNRGITESAEEFLKRLDSRLQNDYDKKMKRRKGNATPESPPAFNSFFLLNNERLPEHTLLKDLFQSEGLKLRISDTDYDVVINSPTVEKMTLPSIINVNCIIYPEEFVAKWIDASQCKFEWFRTKSLSTSLKKCGEGFFYTVKEDDLDHYLKLTCLPIMNGKEGPVFEVISKNKVEKFENNTEILKRHEYTKEKTKADEFRMVTYNILADMYVCTKEAKTVLFTYCNPSFLEYSYRKTLLNFELCGYNSDIICLQEVDRKFYMYSLAVLFTEWGYECIYNEKEGIKGGCAVLYNRQKFNLLETNQYVFTNEILYNPLMEDIKLKIQENSNLMTRLKSISSLMQVLVLETSLNFILVIGNSHFYFHPDADHIRLLQGITSWRILSNVADKFKQKEPNKKISIVLCGDLNSTPDCGFHQFLSKGLVDDSHIDWKSNENEKITNVSCSQSLNVKSAYDNTKFTNYTPLFKGCLDYIYFQSDNLELKQTVPIPTEEVLSKHSGIPSQFFPSDHVALVADLKFKND